MGVVFAVASLGVMLIFAVSAILALSSGGEYAGVSGLDWFLFVVLYYPAAFGGPVVFLIGVVVVVFQLWMILWPKIFRGHALGFGEKGLLQNLLVRIAADRSFDRNSKPREYEIKGKGLHHSRLYQDSEVVKEIAACLSTTIASSHPDHAQNELSAGL